MTVISNPELLNSTLNLLLKINLCLFNKHLLIRLLILLFFPLIDYFSQVRNLLLSCNHQLNLKYSSCFPTSNIRRNYSLTVKSLLDDWLKLFSDFWSSPILLDNFDAKFSVFEEQVFFIRVHFMSQISEIIWKSLNPVLKQPSSINLGNSDPIMLHKHLLSSL